MSICPSDDMLRAYLAGRLDRSRPNDIEAHVEECASCQAVLARMTGDAESCVRLSAIPSIASRLER